MARWKSLTMYCGVATLLAEPGTPAVFAEDLSRQPFKGLSCEAHVWAFGRPNFHPKSSMFIKVAPTSAEDLNNPLSSVNIFDPLKRANSLSDVQITALFPGAESVKVIHHAEIVDVDKTPIATIQSPLSTPKSECYADLAISGLYAIFPNPNQPYQPGVAGSPIAVLLAGSDRLEVEFWLQQWPNGKSPKPHTVRRRKDTPLPHVPPATTAMLDAVRASADLNLADFVATVNERRKP